jgi:hypothetical protein
MNTNEEMMMQAWADERADLIEALEQERERSNAFEKENGELLDTLRTMMLGLDSLGVLGMKVAYARTSDGNEWRASILNKRDALTDAIAGWLSWYDAPRPKRRAKRGAKK